MNSDSETFSQAKFTAMAEGTAEDWAAIARAHQSQRGEHIDRIIKHFRLLDNDSGGYAVDRLEHSLQTATRAFQAGRDDEYVVCALLHDIGDVLAPAGHAELGAAVLKPYVSEENHWMVEYHSVFQGYYFFHHFDLDRNMREQYRGHPVFEQTVEFCHLFDQCSFDPNYRSMPLEAFVPVMRRVMETPKRLRHQAAE